MQIGQSVEFMTRTRKYQPVGVLAADTGREFVVTCEWTEEDDRKFGKNLSNYCKAYNAIF